MQITAEMTQTYDLLKFAIARSNGSNFSLQHKTKCPSETTMKRQKRSANVQMTRTVGGVVRPVNTILHNDKICYLRMIPLYQAEMASLESSNPEIYGEFITGNWVVNKNKEVPFCMCCWWRYCVRTPQSIYESFWWACRDHFE